MTDLFDLPTRRELPDTVRDRARTTILTELDADRPWALRAVGPLSISAAAVVAVLAAGFVGLVAEHGSAAHSAAARPTTEAAPPTAVGVSASATYQVRDHAAPSESDDRCKAQAGHEPAGTPGPARWQPIVTVSASGVDLIAYQTPDGPLFCEVTPTTVTLSEPATQRTAAATLTFVTPMGSAAGVTDPLITAVTVRPVGGTGDDGRPAVVEGGVFLLPNGFPTGPLATAVIASRGSQGADTSSPPSYPGHTSGAALPTITDRTVPPADQSSVAGQRLAACLAHSGVPVVVPQAWTPGASATLGDGASLQLGRYGDLLALCRTAGGRTTASVRNLAVAHGQAGGNSDVLAGLTSEDSTTATLTGITTSSKVARVQVIHAGGVVATATVQNGTFLVPGLANDPAATPPVRGMTLVALAADGAVLTRLPLG